MIRRQVFAAVRVLLGLTVLLGVLYPLAVTGLAALTMPGRAGGTLVRSGEQVVGSALIGQEFTGPEWFHGRPDPFDPTASGATNLGPSNELLAGAVRLAADDIARVEEWAGPIPADAVSGQRQRPGSAHQPGVRPAPGAPGRRGPRPGGRGGAAPGGIVHRRPHPGDPG